MYKLGLSRAPCCWEYHRQATIPGEVDTTIPVLTNSRDIEAGEELLYYYSAAPKAEKAKKVLIHKEKSEKGTESKKQKTTHD